MESRIFSCCYMSKVEKTVKGSRVYSSAQGLKKSILLGSYSVNLAVNTQK